MGIVRFAQRFAYTLAVLAVFIVFLGVFAVAVMPENILSEIDVPAASVICAIRALTPADIQPVIISTLTSSVILYFVGQTLDTMTRRRPSTCAVVARTGSTAATQLGLISSRLSEEAQHPVN